MFKNVKSSVLTSHLFSVALYIWLENVSSHVQEKWPVTFKDFCRLPDGYGHLSTSDWGLGSCNLSFWAISSLTTASLSAFTHGSLLCQILEGSMYRLAGVSLFCQFLEKQSSTTQGTNWAWPSFLTVGSAWQLFQGTEFGDFFKTHFTLRNHFTTSS